MTAFPYSSLQVSAGGGPVLRARALLFNAKGEILVVQHPARHLAEGQARPAFWALPGGKVDALESAMVAIVRELEEELDLKVPDLRLRFIAELPFINSLEFFFVGSIGQETTAGMDRAVQSGELAAVAFQPFGAADLFKPAAIATMSLEKIQGQGVEYLGEWTS